MLTRKKWHTCNKHMNERLDIRNASQIIKKRIETDNDVSTKVLWKKKNRKLPRQDTYVDHWKLESENALRVNDY